MGETSNNVAFKCAITPIYEKDPPLWNGEGRLPEPLHEMLAPMPDEDAAAMELAVCVPFFTEPGFTLQRTLQALALQRADLRRYRYLQGVPPSQLPEMHVFAIADGWAKPDGSRIMSESMLQEIGDLFAAAGAPLDMAQLRHYLNDDEEEEEESGGDEEEPAGASYDGKEGQASVHATEIGHADAADRGDKAAGGGRNGGAGLSISPSAPASNRQQQAATTRIKRAKPEAVLLQLVAPAPPVLARRSSVGTRTDWGSAKKSSSSSNSSVDNVVLRPLQVDCTWALLSHARNACPVGTVTSQMEAAARMERKQNKAKQAQVGGGYDGDEKYAFLLAQHAEAGLGGSSDVRQVAFTNASPQVVWEENDTDGFQPIDSDAAVGAAGAASSSSSSLPHWQGHGKGRDASGFGLQAGSELGMNDATQPLYITLMIKRRNHKKHHSHRWFFEAFAAASRQRSAWRLPYYFATDCGTLYAPYCLAELIAHMEANRHCAAATGHQRIMTTRDQADPLTLDPEGAAAGFLRRVQAFDFESGLCVFNGAHALAGFLPVVPGPCGLFRASAVTHAILTQVRQLCSSPAREDGLIQGNLKIAEDRILSYLLVLTSQAARGSSSGGGGDGDGGKALLEEEEEESPGGGAWETHWVPSTVFYFEAETTLKELVLQRRRWLNGTTAGYLWLLGQPGLYAGMWGGHALSWLVFTLCLLQLLVFTIVLCLPGLLAYSSFLAFSGVGLVLRVLEWVDPIPAAAVQAFSWLPSIGFWFSVATYVGHVLAARAWRTPFAGWLWSLRVAFNAFFMLCLAVVGVTLCCVSLFDEDRLDRTLGYRVVKDLQLATALGTYYMLTPFVLAMMHSAGSFTMMCASFPAYFVFLPTILGDFFAYSLARYDDLSWGTKAVAAAPHAAASFSSSSSRGAIKGSKSKLQSSPTSSSHVSTPASSRVSTPLPQQQQQQTSTKPAVGGWQSWDLSRGKGAASSPSTAAVAAAASPPSLPGGRVDYELLAEEHAARQSSFTATNVITGLELAVCLSLALTGFVYRSSVNTGLLYLSTAIGGVSFIVMVISMAYFAPRTMAGATSAPASSTTTSRLTSLAGATMVFAAWAAMSAALVLMIGLLGPARQLFIWAAWAFYGTLAGLVAYSLLVYGVAPAVVRVCASRSSRTRRNNKQ